MILIPETLTPWQTRALGEEIEKRVIWRGSKTDFVTDAMPVIFAFLRRIGATQHIHTQTEEPVNEHQDS